MTSNQFFNKNEPIDKNKKETLHTNEHTHFTATKEKNVCDMNINECVTEYLAIDTHLKTLRDEIRKWNQRTKLIQKKICNLLKNANKKKIDINKKITLEYEKSNQQVGLTKDNIRKTLNKHFKDSVLVEEIVKVLTEKRDTYERERLKKKKYKE